MSVLIEALSLVIPRRALDVSWPGGTDAFRLAMCADECPSRRNCADDVLVSVSFFTPEQAEIVAEQLRERGLVEVVDDRFQDFAFVDQRHGPTLPCPWLHWRRHREGYTYAWLEGTDPSLMAAPADWEPEQSRRLTRTDARDDPDHMFRLGEEKGFEIWLDLQTGQLCRGFAEDVPESPHPSTVARPGAEPGMRIDAEPAISAVADSELREIIAHLEQELGVPPRSTPSGPDTPSATDAPATNTSALPMDDLFARDDADVSRPMPPSDSPAVVPARELVRPIENAYVVPGTTLVAGEYPGSPPGTPASDVEAKLQRFLDAGVTAFIDLTGPADSLAPYEPTLRELASRRGIAVNYQRLSIADMDVCDVPHMERVLDAIEDELSSERTVYVHCWGGVGRTGMVVGCWLVRQGHTGEEALAEVARLFGTMSPAKVRRHQSWGSPQTDSQRAMVKGWAAAVRQHEESECLRAERLQAAEQALRDARRAGDVILGLRRELQRLPVGDVLVRPSEFGALERVRRDVGGGDLEYPRDLVTRVRGCLLGGAVGDALGWPVEFLSLANIRARYGAAGIQEYDAAAPGGAGAITDDTQMTLFTAEGVLRSTVRNLEHWWQSYDRSGFNGGHGPHPGMMAYAYTRWLLTQEPNAFARRPQVHAPTDGWLFGVRQLHVRRAAGNTCLAALAGGIDGSLKEPVNDSKGCGGVMRVAPIGLVVSEDPFAYGAMAAKLTHGHPSGYLSAGAYAQVINDLLYRKLPLRHAIEQALARLRCEPGHEETTAALERALQLALEAREPSPELVERLGGGWTGEQALAIGVYCALVARDFAHGVRLAVNHSGDSDSTGSITGALLGVQHGEHAIPRAWLEQLELREQITLLAEDLVVGYGGGEEWRERYPGG